MLIDEFILFSDLHAHNFRYGSKRIEYENGVFNSRLVDTLNVLDEIMAYAIAHGIKLILFGGDMFHTRQTYNTEVFNLVFNKIKEFSDSGLELRMIPGNHDYADRDGRVHALQPFEHLENVHVSEPPYSVHNTDKFVLWTVPYTPDLDVAKDALETMSLTASSLEAKDGILLAHLGMQGAVVGSDYVLVSEGDIRVKDVDSNKFAACFFGHYHEHQQIFKNGWYIGATHEHNWGDSGGKRGFLHAKYTTEGVSFKRIETSAPKFVKIEDENEEHDIKPNDFVKIFVDKVTPQLKRGLEKSMNVAKLEVLPRLDNIQTMVKLEASQLNPEAALEAWAKANPLEDEKLGEVIDLGKKLLKEAMEKSL